MGAGKMERVRRGTRQCTLISAVLAVITAAAALLCGGALFRVFNKEASVIALCMLAYYLRYHRAQARADAAGDG